MVTLRCDRCHSQLEVSDLSSLVDWSSEMLKLPKDWFEWDGQLFCNRHKLVMVPVTHTVEDR